MNLIALILVLALTVIPAYGESQQKKKKTQSFFERLFQPKPTPHETKPRKHITKPRPQSTPQPQYSPQPSPTATPGVVRSKTGAYIVDARWMAYYWEQELAWDYAIPEDQDIKFIDGKYHVPPVVYRHYEDMVNASASR